MLKISATNPYPELRQEAKQLITDAVFRAYKRYGSSPYTWETYWKTTKQHHFNLWIWILQHNSHIQTELRENKKLSWYFAMIEENSATSELWSSKISAKFLKFGYCHPDLTPDNPDFFALTF